MIGWTGEGRKREEVKPIRKERRRKEEDKFVASVCWYPSSLSHYKQMSSSCDPLVLLSEWSTYLYCFSPCLSGVMTGVWQVHLQVLQWPGRWNPMLVAGWDSGEKWTSERDSYQECNYSYQFTKPLYFKINRHQTLVHSSNRPSESSSQMDLQKVAHNSNRPSESSSQFK